MKKIKVKFTSFYKSFVPETSFEYELLLKHFKVQIVDDNPDLIIVGGFCAEFNKYDCPKISIRSEFNSNLLGFVDVSLCSDEVKNSMGKQYSGAVEFDGMRQLLAGKQIPQYILKYKKNKKTKFCNFMYANHNAKYRIKFCKALMKYKWVDCLGKVLRNTELIVPKEISPEKEENWRSEQLYINKDYKFTIAFENYGATGYVTEKIIQSLLSGSIPIYWGADDIAEYINPKAFINVRDFKNFNEVIKYVKKIDNDDKLYQQYINQPILLPNSKLYNMQYDVCADWLKEKIEILLSDDYNIVGKKSNIYFKLFQYKIRLKRLLQNFICVFLK